MALSSWRFHGRISLPRTKLLAKGEIIGQAMKLHLEINEFLVHAERQISQIKRRVMDVSGGEIIAHGEKVFSLFEPHTEWVSKGKAGEPVEFGVKVCILEDQHRFILHHHVMEKQTDDQVAVMMVTQAKQRFPNLNATSFDKGFHSPANQTQLPEHLEQVTLPRKGKRSQQVLAVETSDAFVAARRAHSWPLGVRILRWSLRSMRWASMVLTCALITALRGLSVMLRLQ